ncbi:MAG TPA: energy transducer TonB [Gammaproteobacteria bacterium]
MRSTTLALSALALLAAMQPAAAQQLTCDCTTIVDACNADVQVSRGFIEVTTDHSQCARVDYIVDGLPFVSLAMNGSDRREWSAQSASPRVLVQSCQVCRATPSGAAQQSAITFAPTRAGGAGEGGLEPLIAVTPTYPEAARARRLEGYVEVELTVTPGGTVENARVTASQPSGVFDQAALAAVSRWRYPADPERAPVTVTERIEFQPDPVNAAPPPRAAAASTAPGPRNQCVREDAAYHFGEMVEVGLINACDDPLLVYGCSSGVGRYAGRWVCRDTESARALLLPPGDDRVGTTAMVESADGLGSYTYVDTFSVTRAPNSEYWWVACRLEDEECRSSARQWTRGVAGQPAAVNPQDRTRMAVARSN